jgi:ribosomal protein S18 acetylase RimI-like enzyme
MSVDTGRVPADPLVPRSLVWATDIDVLPLDRVVERHDGYLAVRSPSNPAHYWGTLLVFDEPPEVDDVERWEGLFAASFGDDPRVRHRTFAWDRIDATRGAADAFVARGYRLDDNVGLVASPASLRQHPRASRDVVVRALDPAPGADEDLWRGVVELGVAGRDPALEEQSHRAYLEARQHDVRRLFRRGRGAWYVALDGSDVVAGCGVVVTGGRGRFQSVETVLTHRRRGICSRLVVDAAHDAAATHGATSLVIVAEVGYHALGLYESLGFERREHVFGVSLWPQ